MKNNFQTYVVNLEKDILRKKSIINQLKKQNIEKYKIIKAVDGSKFDSKQFLKFVYKDYKGKNKWFGKMSNGQVGCALSHIKIYKMFLKTNYKFALILEDDAIFKKKFDKNLIDFILESFKENKQIILLSELKEFYKKSMTRNSDYEIVEVASAFFTHGYFINRKAAKSLINFNFPVKTVADNFVFFKIYKGVNIYGLNPFIVTQNKVKFKTTIKQDNIREKTPYLIKFRLYKIKNLIRKLFIPFGSHTN